MFPIWYILHCEEGNEKKAAELLRRQYPYSRAAEIFLVTSERMKRYGGKWHCCEEMLFKGCVFVKADAPNWLEDAAGKTDAFRVSEDGGYSSRLSEPGRKFLEEAGGEAHRIPMSKGFIRDGTTFVTEGPLRGRERKIRKIDRHKRMAKIDSPLECCRKQGLWIGLEIMAKS
ncbi:MAG: hypothetical protein HFG83_08420 [Dorea sp.]|nr:hypothetical protein [Dorea sp.]MCI9453837.1 hypothetical protein [Dorea sp.]